jgi:hypothetical protein
MLRQILPIGQVNMAILAMLQSYVTSGELRLGNFSSE